MSAITAGPIRTEADYEAALREIEAPMSAELGTEEGDRLDVLVTLIQAYEARHHAIEAPDPMALIEHVMDARGLTRSDLELALGRSGRASEVLSRRRPLTLRMVRNLHQRFGLPAEVLIPDYPVLRASTR